MTPHRSESELVALRQLAEELASRRKERLTSVHLLAAVARSPSAAADLMNERRLTPDSLLRAGRATTDDINDPVRATVQKARGIASRMGASAPGGVHVLIALTGERKSAAYQAIEQCGADVGRLRAAALNLGLGLLGRRRAVTRRDSAEAPRELSPALDDRAARRASSRVAKPAAGVTIPLFPPPSRAERPSATATLVPDPTRPKSPASQPPPASAAVPTSEAPTVATRAKKKKARRFALDPHKFATLCGFGRNLTEAAEKGELDPVVGRDAEVEQALDVLAKRSANNPLLIGVAGVGKTSVVRALAQRIVLSEDVASLDDRIIVEIPISELIAGTGVRGALAMRIAAIRKEVLASEGRVVLFFDEIHQLFAGDAAEEVAGELKLALAKGELPCIGATTHDEYKKAIESDAALARRFTVVEVEEPSREDAYLILEALAPSLSAHHGVGFDEEALALAVNWSVRYLPGRALPDKAVAVVDLAGARTRRRGGDRVGAEVVAEIVAEAADMPAERLLETDADRLLELESILAERVVGHREPIQRIAHILRRNAAGLGARRPIGTFLLLGPTGVGKTETAKAVAEVLFHAETAMTRIDLAEYGEPHSVARLIGSPPGYVGHEAGGQLTESVRRRPYQVVLLDEIEKAHPDVLDTFLGMFDEGRLTDGRGRTVDFTNTVIMMTSNLGADETGASAKRRVGFGNDSGPDAAGMERAVTAAARGTLTPELYNRIDEVLVFAPLAKADVREITRRMLGGIARSLLARRGLRLEFDDAAVEHLLDAGGYDPALGARPMKRTVARLIEAPLAEKILRGELEAGDVALVTAEAGEIVIDVLDGARGSAAE